MTLSEAINKQYAVSIPRIPDDGVMRAFPIDRFRIGFVLGLGDCGVFGCWSDRQAYLVNPAGVASMDLSETSRSVSPDIEFERLIVSIAKAQEEAGIEFSQADSDRLKLAVSRIEAAS